MSLVGIHDDQGFSNDTARVRGRRTRSEDDTSLPQIWNQRGSDSSKLLDFLAVSKIALYRTGSTGGNRTLSVTTGKTSPSKWPMTGISIFRWWLLKTSNWDLKCLSYLPRICFGFLVADDVGGWLVIGTMRKFRSANGINRSSLAWDSFGWQGYGIRKQIDFEFFFFNVSKTKTFKPWKKSIEATAPATLFKTSWSPVDWLMFFQVQCWHHLHWRSSDATTSCLASMSSCLHDRSSRTSIHRPCLGEVHTSSTPISSMPESAESKGQGGQGPINGKQQLEHNRDRMAPRSSKVRFFVKEKLRGIGDMLFWPAWLLLFGMKMTSVKRYEDLEALGGQIIEGDECAAMVFV